MKKFVFSLFVVSLTTTFAFGASFKSGEDVVRAMHSKYDGKWYKTMTFVQKNTRYLPDGKKK